MLIKDVYERYLLPSNFATLNPRRYGNGTFTSGVYYTLPMAVRSQFVMLNKVKHLAQSHKLRSFINCTAWANALLILGKGNAKARRWDKQEYRIPRLFVLNKV